MDYIAISKNIKISPRKIRLVVDSVKQKDLKLVLNSLSVIKKRAALPLKKALDSAIANAVNNFKVDRQNLKIKDIIVTEGLSLKRFHFAGRGRIRPYKRRASHIKVILADNNIKNQKLKIKNEKEEFKTGKGKEATKLYGTKS